MPEYILKTDESGHVVLQNNRPVYRKVDGEKEEEIELDAGRLFAKITELNTENETRRKNQEQLKTRASDLESLFEGIETDDRADWIAKAKEAMELSSRLDKKELVEAEKVAELEATITREVEAKFETKIDQLKGKLEKTEAAVEAERERFHRQVLSAKFAESKFIAEECVNPRVVRRVLEQDFGPNFAVAEDGSVTAYHDASHERQILNDHTENATFDQALAALVEKHPDRDAILRGEDVSGAGITSNGEPGYRGENPFITGNLTKIAQLTKTNPARAKQLQEAAKAEKAKRSAA